MNSNIFDLIHREIDYAQFCMSMEHIFPVRLTESSISIHVSDVGNIKEYPALPAGYEGVEHTAKFTLNFPFKIGLTRTIVFKSIEDIAVAVKNAFDEMYSVSQNMGPQLVNTYYTGPFGDAYHCIEDLYIEDILYNPDTTDMFINLGS